jgi:hypothetical protein
MSLGENIRETTMVAAAEGIWYIYPYGKRKEI